MAKDTGKKLIDMMYGQNPDQAAFGVYPQLKPKRTAQDPQAAKNVPVDLLRGAVSGVLGAPGDIESLIRLLPGLDENTILPTSEDIEKRLPFKSDTPVSRAATGLGQIGGGFYTGPGSPFRLVGAIPGALKHGAGEFAKASAGSASHVVKPKGGNWTRNTVESLVGELKRNPTAADSLEEMKRVYPPEVLEFMSPETRAQVDRAFPHLEQQVALNKWVDSNLTNYIKKDMATPDDVVRKLAEQGIVHIPSEQVGVNRYKAPERRAIMGGEQLAQSPEAQAWENATDVVVRSDRVGDLLDLQKKSTIHDGYVEPWMVNADPNTKVYTVNSWGSNLGFDHILDVLREDLTTGRIRPEQLNKVSMEQAVRRTYEYDQELAAKMAQARAAQREGLPVYKEYPEGYRWIELNRPGAFASESEAMGHSVRGYEPPQGHPDWIETSGDRGSLGYGHGGWEAIKSGKAKVYSLVDPKGNPHVTVEVGGNNHLDFNKWWDSQPKELRDEINARARRGEHNMSVFEAPEYLAARDALPPRITQIKGKQNSAPADEYLPFVQDFVKSSQWSDVGDLQNTGLIRRGNVFTPTEKQGLIDLGQDVPEYLTQEDIARLRRARGDLPPEDGMAHGGRVHISDNPDVMQMELAGGGLVKGLIKAVKGTQEVLPAAEREANLAKMLEQSATKERLYHATPADFSQFKPGGNTPERSGPAIWMTPDKDFQPAAHNIRRIPDKPNYMYGSNSNMFTPGTNVMPVYSSVKNPLITNEKTWRQDFKEFGGSPWTLTPNEVQKIKSAGHDGIMYYDKDGKLQEVVAFEPQQVKSAIGNRGTYDVTDPDINKAGGGLVKGLVKAAQAAKEAPSIIIPGKLSNIKEAVRQSKGDFGAKRVERAADEIPNLEKLYREEALRQAFSGDNAKALMSMKPEDFERFAHPLTPLEKPWPGSGPKKETLSTDEYIKYLSGVNEFHDVPFLEINKKEQGLPILPFISGHEGRHRSRALASRGEKSGLVQLLPRAELREPFPRRDQEEYLDALKRELEMTGNLVLPEKQNIPGEHSFGGFKEFQRPEIILPDIYAEGGEVHMAGGGALAKLAKLARAPAKTKQEIEAIAERIAPQVTGEYVRKKPGSAITVADKTKKQFEREKDLPVDIRATTAERVPEPVDIEKLRGDVMIGISGDATVTGKTLYGVGDVRLGSPSPQHGGPQYGLYHDDSHFWASGEDAAKKVQNLARSASELYESPVVGNYIMMGPESINYAQHFADANLQAIDLSKMSKRQIDEFNKIIREGYNYKKKGEQFQRVFPSFPGIEDKESAYLHMAMDPDLRKHFNAVMQKPTVTEKLNMPSGSDIRFAITEPSLRDLESGVTGYSLGRMRPDIAPEGLKLSEHPTYTHDIPGHFMGTSRYPMPYELTFPDVVKSIRENPKQAPYEFGTVQYGSTVQPIDQQLIDELRMYEERMKALTGKAAGGAVEDLSPSDMLYLQSQPDIGKMSPQEQREYVTNIKPDELRQRMQGKYAGGGEITADDLILEERKL